ncbi:MAG TPA: hypothetical protein PL029_07005 [Bacteroidia bacterium]|nr:hypothetical protein [Bacteroidia bacterium]
MKSFFIILIFLSSLHSGRAQNEVTSLNHYKYVHVSSGDIAQFMRVSIYEDVKDRLTACGLKVIRRKDIKDIVDSCAVVYCILEDYPLPGTVLSSSDTCMRLRFKDCDGKLVFLSKTGYSGLWLGGTKWGYENATAEALQSLDNYRYVYFAQ